MSINKNFAADRDPPMMMLKVLTAISCSAISLACQAGDIVQPPDAPLSKFDFFNRYVVAKEVAKREHVKVSPADVEIVQPGVARARSKAGMIIVRFGYEDQQCVRHEADYECETRIRRNPNGFVVTAYEGPQRSVPARAANRHLEAVQRSRAEGTRTTGYGLDR